MEVETGTREYSGRQFSAEDMELIIETTRMYPKLSQKEVAATVCELIGWTTPNGKPKRFQCVEFLRQLEAEGLIKLPARRVGYVRSGHDASKPAAKQAPDEIIEPKEIYECGALSLEIVQPGKRLAQWRKYVSSWHKLGRPSGIREPDEVHDHFRRAGFGVPAVLSIFMGAGAKRKVDRVDSRREESAPVFDSE